MSFDPLMWKNTSRFCGHCSICGGERVSVETTKRPRFVVDGPIIFNYRCRVCGHTWRLLMRAGI